MEDKPKQPRLASGVVVDIEGQERSQRVQFIAGAVPAYDFVMLRGGQRAQGAEVGDYVLMEFRFNTWSGTKLTPATCPDRVAHAYSIRCRVCGCGSRTQEMERMQQ